VYKELLKNIVDLLIEHTCKNYKKNPLYLRLLFVVILYPLKWYSIIITEGAAERFLMVSGIREKFDNICKQAVQYNINKKKGGY
jgi:hypothetical protein